MLLSGTYLGDRYEIIELIGSGGMADVYKARCHKLNRYVAIKVLKPEYSSDHNFVSKFRVEAQSAAGLMHPNIVNVYDVGEENGMYYFVMELVEGITLKNYIEKKIRLTVKEAVSIAIQVSMGIEAAHNNGIIHRDIKPQNIMISKEGKVKVADFGIAKAVSSDTITSHAMGSVHYTSPEQARGGYSDAKSDIYSIGISLFEMVTGHVPFDGETTVAIAIKHIQEEMPSPRLYVPDIPISVEQIILKCTQKNADRRYAVIGELIKDLKHSLMAPDENFVVINQAASNEGTKTMSDSERSEIRKQSSSVLSGPVYDNILPNYGNASGDMKIAGGRMNPQGQAMPQQNWQGQNERYGRGNDSEYAYQNYGYDNEQNVQNQNANRNVYGYDEDFGENYEEEEYNDYPRRQSKSEGKKPSSKNQKSGSKSANKGSGKSGHSSLDYRRGEEQRYRQVQEDDYYEDSNDVDPKMEKVITILMVVAAIIIVIVAVIVIGKVFGNFSSTTEELSSKIEAESGQTIVPSIVGKSVEEASEMLSNAGLTAKATKQESTQYDENYIISQDIEGGSKVSPGTVLNLVVSSGKVTGVVVPDVVGKSEAEAKAILDAEGFKMQKQLQESSAVEKGNVITQNPLGATTAPKGSDVTVMVSAGTTTVTTTVPNVVGKDEATAKSMLEAAGLTCNNVTEENNDTVEAGLVLNQSYADGSTVDEGTNVDITVSLGPAVYTYSCSVAVNAPANMLAGSEAVIVLMNSSGAELARYNTTVFPYNVTKSDIVDSSTGMITVTFLTNEGNWETTAPVSVTFTKVG